MNKPMTIDEKAEALVEMGMAMPTKFDVMFRVIEAQVAARNLDVATVEYTRGKGILYVAKCEHVTRDGKTHVCEGHSHGHVCYHARAGLMMAMKLSGKTLAFDKTGQVKVMVAGHENKAVYATAK